MTRTEVSVAAELHSLETGTLDPARFPHPEHVRLGFEMLARYSFGEAVLRFARGLKLIATRAGRPEVYHETITVAFLAVINERRALFPGENWLDFRTSNTDLLDKRILENWYSAEQLGSDLARRTFCLPQTSSIIAGSSGGFTRIARKAPKRRSAALQS